MNDDWRLECHEAGHAVVGVRCQIPFEYVEKRDDGSGDAPVGVGPLDARNRPHSQDEISRWQLYYAAGAAAEQLVFRNYQESGTQIDRARHERLEKMRSAPRSRAWESDIQSAMTVLDRESVEKVAKALCQHKRLNDEQIYDLLGCKPVWW